MSKIKTKGYIALTTALIVGAVGTVVGVSILTLALYYTKTSLLSYFSLESKGMANACAEEALKRIRLENYVGNGSLTIDGKSCSYNITGTIPNLEIRASNSTTAVNQTTRKVKITIDQINPTIRITSWQEVADF